jgi:tubulin polyglutamylase TTLL2
VTSFQPLCVYLYRRGLARFSSEKLGHGNASKMYFNSVFRYDPNSIGNIFSHLTNSSINKHNPKVKEVIGGGLKWTLSRLYSHLEQNGVNIVRLRQRSVEFNDLIQFH